MFAQTPYGGSAADAAVEKVRRGRDDVLGHDAVGDNPPIVVEVVDEMIERREPLHEAALDPRPFRGLDRARDHVERPRAVDVLTFGVDGERDAHFRDRALGVALTLGELAFAERREVARELRGRGPRFAGRGEELVEERARLVLGPVDAHYFGSPYAQENPKSTWRNGAATRAASTKLVPVRGPRSRAALGPRPRHGRSAPFRCRRHDRLAGRRFAQGTISRTTLPASSRKRMRAAPAPSTLRTSRSRPLASASVSAASPSRFLPTYMRCFVWPTPSISP